MAIKNTTRRSGKPATIETEPPLEKAPTGIRGFDDITDGGLPRGRPALIVGGAGSGKTVFGMEFLVRGALEYGEPGVFMSFEETEKDLGKNFSSIGFNLNDLIARKLLFIDFVYIERKEIEETGEFDLDGLFVRLNSAIEEVGARRVVLDTLEALFSGLSNESILRAELRRLFRWLKEKGVTVVITSERGVNTLTRYGLEEYVADCVILLDHRMIDQVATRRLRVIKYRGSGHGANEYPFLIDENGISILPITSLGLNYPVSSERVPTGVERLDNMLAGGYYQGSSILVSGTPGTGKSTLSAAFAGATCRNGQRCLYFSFEESPAQIMRNMKSVGIDLKPWVDKGLLRFQSSRPALYGLEMHLISMFKAINDLKADAIIVDPVSNFISVGSRDEVRSMLTRLIDFLKSRNITSLFTNLTSSSGAMEDTEVGISSLMDTWILLRDIEIGGERNRGLYVLKSRGTAHSNQIREFQFTRDGIKLLDVYIGPGGVLTGSARLAQEAQEKSQAISRQQDIERNQREIERQRQIMESQVAALRAQFEATKEKLETVAIQERTAEKMAAENREAMAHQRKADRDDIDK